MLIGFGIVKFRVFRRDRDLSLDAAFITPLYSELARRLSNGEKPAAIIEQMEGDAREEAAQALLSESNVERDQITRAVDDCLNKIRLFQLEEQINRIKTDKIKTE